jgi:putative phosphoribosyl transferase
MTARFLDRREAGERLALLLSPLAGRSDVLVLALPRGGVPVGFEIARALGAPLDVFVVRKLGVPGQEELAMGAIASGGSRVLNDEVIELLRLPVEAIEEAARREAREVERRERLYRGAQDPSAVAGRVIVLTDDGIATGSTMLAAVQALRSQKPARIVVAVPVCVHSVAERLRHYADEVICVIEPDMLDGVSMWYDDFDQTGDDEVRSLLHEAVRHRPIDSTQEHAMSEQSVVIPAGTVQLHADLAVPARAAGLIIFAHGSGSGRRSPRNRFVANVLQNGGFATLLLDLLTAEEEQIDAQTAHLRFDIGLLVQRLVGSAAWAEADARTGHLDVGYFGASTGAAAALVAAARRPARVRAVVSRGGRPDLAGDALPLVRAPTLLIVGGRDAQVLELNRQAAALLRCEKQIEIVPNATHLFEETGALERVAELALNWFSLHFELPASEP